MNACICHPVLKVLPQTPGVERILLTLYQSNKTDVRALMTLFHAALLRTSATTPWISQQLLFDIARSQGMDSKVAIILSLSELELCLVIAFKHALSQDLELINFEVIYNSYNSFMIKSSGSEMFSREVAFKAFERLVQLDLVRWAQRSTLRSLPTFQPVHLMAQPEQVDEAIDKYTNLPLEIRRWGRNLVVAVTSLS